MTFSDIKRDNNLRLRAFLRRPLESRSPLWLGVTAVGVIVVAVVALLGYKSLGVGKHEYRAEFAQAAGIASGAPITSAGIQVGTVTGTKLDGDHVEVTLSIDDGVTLGADTGAAIKITTLLGSRYVELRPAGSGPIPHDTIALSRTEVPYDLQSALQDASSTFNQVDADRIGGSLTTLSDQLEGTPAVVPRVLANIRDLSAVIAGRRGQLGSLLENTQKLTTMISDQQKDLSGLVNQGQNVLAQINTRQAAIKQLLKAATSLVDEIAPIAVNDKPQIDKLIADLGDMTQMIGRNDALLRNILQVLPVTWRNIADIAGTGREIDATIPAGILVDSWVCALSGRAAQLNLPQYVKGCR